MELVPQTGNFNVSDPKGGVLKTHLFYPHFVDKPQIFIIIRNVRPPPLQPLSTLGFFKNIS